MLEIIKKFTYWLMKLGKNKLLVRIINLRSIYNTYIVGIEFSKVKVIVFYIIIGVILLYFWNIMIGIETVYCEDTILRSGNTITIIKDDGTVITKVVKETVEQKIEEFPIWIRIIGMAFSACLFIIIVPVVLVIYAVTGVWLG